MNLKKKNAHRGVFLKVKELILCSAPTWIVWTHRGLFVLHQTPLCLRVKNPSLPSFLKLISHTNTDTSSLVEPCLWLNERMNEWKDGSCMGNSVNVRLNPSPVLKPRQKLNLVPTKQLGTRRAHFSVQPCSLWIICINAVPAQTCQLAFGDDPASAPCGISGICLPVACWAYLSIRSGGGRWRERKIERERLRIEAYANIRCPPWGTVPPSCRGSFSWHAWHDGEHVSGCGQRRSKAVKSNAGQTRSVFALWHKYPDFSEAQNLKSHFLCKLAKQISVILEIDHNFNTKMQYYCVY